MDPRWEHAFTLKRGTPEYNAMRDLMFSEWHTNKLLADKAREKELDLRQLFVKLAGDNSKRTGTETITLSDGRKVKIVKKLNYKFTSAQSALDALTALRAHGPEGTFLADRLVSWFAELVVGEYHRLDSTREGEAYKAILDPVLTVTDATPTLEVQQPKG